MDRIDRLLKALAKFRRSISAAELRSKSDLSEADFTIALGWMRRKDWATIAKEGGLTLVAIADAGREALATKGPDEALLAALERPCLGDRHRVGLHLWRRGAYHGRMKEMIGRP